MSSKSFASQRVLLLFALTILCSAFLLFQVQPMISKFILPWFGGSPAVWTTAMLFFQCVLCAGYVYAHVLTRLHSRQRQAGIHIALLLLGALLAFTILPDASWKPTGEEAPALQVLLILSASVGVPYFCWQPQALWCSTGFPTPHRPARFTGFMPCPTLAPLRHCCPSRICSSPGLTCNK